MKKISARSFDERVSIVIHCNLIVTLKCKYSESTIIVRLKGKCGYRKDFTIPISDSNTIVKLNGWSLSICMFMYLLRYISCFQKCFRMCLQQNNSLHVIFNVVNNSV